MCYLRHHSSMWCNDDDDDDDIDLGAFGLTHLPHLDAF